MVWFHKAAQQGDAAAQFHLGMMHHRISLSGYPKEAPESKIEAYMWFQIAAAQGYKDSASACETMSLAMTCEEVADGNRRAASFAPTGNHGLPAVVNRATDASC